MTYRIPDFRAEAKLIYYTHLSVDDIEKDLRYMFMRGLEMGHRAGFKEGDAKGWVEALEMDREFQNNANKKA